MTFFARLATLLSADAHGALDAMADPALLLKQHLREAADDLERKRHRLEALDEERERLEGELARRLTLIQTLEGDIHRALDAKEENLARYAVRRQLIAVAERDDLQREVAAHAETCDRLRELLQRQSIAFEELQARVHTRLAQLERDPHRPAPPAITEHDVELELLRRRAAGGAP